MITYVIEVDNDGFKVYDSGGSEIDPATDGVLQAVRDKLIEADAAIDSIDGKVATESTLATRATETTAQAIRDRIGEVQETPTQYTLLDRIREINLVSGIKKIVDALPTGDNWIGRVKIGNGTNIVGQVLDGAAYRLLTAAKIARGATDLVTLDALDTTSGQGRLKATLYTPEDEPVAFGSVPANPESIKNDFVKTGGGSPSSDLLVDGSVTPVEFSYNADTTHDISIQEIKFTLASNSVTFGSGYFGAVSGPLANGLLIEITSNGQTGALANLTQNESFVNFASPGGFTWVVSSKDMLSSAYLIGGGLKLYAGTSDKVKVTVRDDIDSAGVYFRCFVKGNLLA